VAVCVKFQPLAKDENRRVFADFIADTHRVHADVSFLPQCVVAVAIKHQGIFLLPRRLRMASANPSAVPLGRVFLKR